MEKDLKDMTEDEKLQAKAKAAVKLAQDLPASTFAAVPDEDIVILDNAEVNSKGQLLVDDDETYEEAKTTTTANTVIKAATKDVKSNECDDTTKHIENGNDNPKSNSPLSSTKKLRIYSSSSVNLAKKRKAEHSDGIVTNCRRSTRIS